jgi:hypothetical protein
MLDIVMMTELGGLLLILIHFSGYVVIYVKSHRAAWSLGLYRPTDNARFSCMVCALRTIYFVHSTTGVSAETLLAVGSEEF